ncbi:hypothetical protein EQK45_01920 [Lactiplantibacillus plantarum]|uniref:hypothetical protein n=1 Tax=Lactiplantibacillus plantarum TaxID=1590 RepID=UPI000D172551|nr:hypothetical protein [Lactiplantibacillus plantarum]KAB1954803.1 hypothetical protein F8276_07220 [Lactiplantibacillus plantarum]MCT3241000.1 hypothetical protein [Lactiplantibacillus plantarum]MDN7033103.1 hypothetical protein [Lactiplantibacillus plantarum]MDN7043358.1 hypothetical protein [Lactiplantibacillus plantarum]MYU97766.1 hypothetical protein [Lactiplantibacillus plantarum]
MLTKRDCVVRITYDALKATTIFVCQPASKAAATRIPVPIALLHHLWLDTGRDDKWLSATV